MVTEAEIKKAVGRKRDYILANLESISLKTCRQELEKDLKLEPDGLKPFKHLLSELIDQVIASAKAGEAGEQPGDKPAKKKKSASKEKEDASEKPKKKTKTAAAAPGKRKASEQQPAKPAGPRQYSKRVIKLRKLCQEATISVAPSLYARNKTDEELEAALEELLKKNGLSAGAGKDEIAEVKRQLTLQRDLDGIDTSNIVEGGRRNRRGAAAPTVNYRQMAMDSEAESSAQEDEESGSEAEFDGDAVSGEEEAEAENGSAAKRKQQGPGARAGKKRQPAKEATAAGGDDEAGGSSSDEGSEGFHEVQVSDDGGKEQQQEPQAPNEKASPDENKPSSANVRQQVGKAGHSKQQLQEATRKAAATALEDSSDDEQPPKKPRAVLADWSDDE